MDIRKVHISNRSDLEFFEKLYIESFPRCERRPVFELNHLVENNEKYSVCILSDKDLKVGFLTFWTFDFFIFVEHFAIDPDFRNSGYGKSTLESFLKIVDLPLVLEVELPETELANRRIDFYKRQGFILSEVAYEQPPYETEFDAIPMRIMSHGFDDFDSKFSVVKALIYKNVFQL